MKGCVVKKSVVFFLIALVLGSADASMLQNGDFDDNVGLSGRAWRVFNAIPGWTTTQGPGIEIQRNTIVAAHSGSQYVELDSHGARNSNSRMEQQNIYLTAGSYELAFHYRPRTGNENDNGIGFGAYSKSINFDWSIDDPTLDDWTRVSQRFSIVDAGNYNFYFTALGNYPFDGDRSNTLGGFIDTVSLNPVPEPASLLLIGVGLLGIARTGRMRK